MARLRSGILGQVRGKVAGVVGGQWKDRNYIREYVKPANPNTTGQQVQRGLMARCVLFAKLLTGPVFNVYVDKFEKSMSGFNRFVKTNIARFVDPTTYTDLLLTQGKLSFAGLSARGYTTGTGMTSIQGNDSVGSNGLTTDLMFCCIYDKTTGYMFFPEEEVPRSAAFPDFDLPAGLTATNLTIWAWMCRRDDNGNVTMVSSSVAYTMVAV